MEILRVVSVLFGAVDSGAGYESVGVLGHRRRGFVPESQFMRVSLQKKRGVQ